MQLAGDDVEVDPGHDRRAVLRRTVTAAQPDPRGPGDDVLRQGALSTASTSSTTAVASAVSWNRAPTSRSGRYASGASRMTRTAVCRSSDPPASRIPAVTATRPTDRVPTRSRAVEDRNATRSTDSVARRWASVVAATAAT